MSYKNVKDGGSLESHIIETEDGYCLTLQRLCYKPKHKRNSYVMETISEDGLLDLNITRRPAVLIVHGLVSSGPHWCMNNTEQDLPYKLANDGYDCWLANLRGTPLSRKHIKVSSDSSEFWDFSWHEMAYFDFSKMVDYILEMTGNEKLSYIGHSMGCAVFFAAMALKPEYNSKIEVMIALAPSVYGKHIRNKLARLSVPVGTFLGKLRAIYSREIFPITLIAIAKKIVFSSIVVSPERLGAWVLRHLGSRCGVLGTNQIEKVRMREIAGHLPAPTSLKVFCHGTQCFASGRFRQYCYGKVINMKKYGQPHPPLYDLSQTKIPVATFYSHSDQLCTKQDVGMLAKELPNLIGNFGINHPQFAHTDFMFGKDAHSLVYDKVLSIFSTHVKPSSQYT